jgi:hypothetical protein
MKVTGNIKSLGPLMVLTKTSLKLIKADLSLLTTKVDSQGLFMAKEQMKDSKPPTLFTALNQHINKLQLLDQ